MLMRQFGLELEHISELEHHQLARVLQDHKIHVDTYATGHPRCPEGCYSGWQVKTDGSITSGDNYPYAIELTSPPLTFKNASEIRRAINMASKHGGVNSSCGLHVHVHVPEMHGLRTDSQLYGVLERAWRYAEQVFFSYMPPSRRMSDYCRPGLDASERYQALNLLPLYEREGRGRDTVEFRLHNATLNHAKALSFAALCVHFVQKVVDLYELWLNRRVDALDPMFYFDPPPTKIKTRKNGDIVLHRKDRKWKIESRVGTMEAEDLREVFKDLYKDLGLAGKHHLIAFRYPKYGNAMTELCKTVGLVGPFAGYLEDRYERVLKKHGPMSERGRIAYSEDEADYYNEPEWEETVAARRAA
jgi:hypothetical protein